MLASLVVAVYVLLLFTAMRWRSKGPGGPWTMLLRGFVPSWHFYDRLGHRPLLQVRHQLDDQKWSTWQSFYALASRRWLGLLHQPQVCAQLFQQSLIDQLAIELGDHRLSPEALIRGGAYLSVSGFARSLAHALSPDAVRMQFRLLLVDPLFDRSHPSTWCSEPISEDDERLILLSEPLSIGETQPGLMKDCVGDSSDTKPSTS